MACAIGAGTRVMMPVLQALLRAGVLTLPYPTLAVYEYLGVSGTKQKQHTSKQASKHETQNKTRHFIRSTTRQSVREREIERLGVRESVVGHCSLSLLRCAVLRCAALCCAVLRSPLSTRSHRCRRTSSRTGPPEHPFCSWGWKEEGS